ncbi:MULTISPECIES: universal stress protein [Burkholderia]|uniref:universal stress protein n=1 Tax=Burkholderia TaxID=32008 RepID=UPI0008639603|nr:MULTISPECIES: universal stress protein [Burkholderia]AOL04207.1 universal stress protein UspA [Burkholderia contaminans]TCW70047.1 universal stress protein [Burkholderia sp. SRS-25]
MSTTTSPIQAVPAPQRVLIAIDGSTASAHALAYAKAFLPSNAAVHIISVAENPRTLVPLGSKAMAFLESARVELLRDASDALSRAKAAVDRDDLVIDTEVIDLATHGGDVVNALADSVQTWQAELVIVGARQHHGLLGWVEGTVSGTLGKLVGCPLLIVPEGFASVAEHLPRRMLFAVDGSTIALDALRTALTFSRPDTEFRAIYVVDRPPMLGDFVLVGALEEALIDEGNHVLRGATAILEGTARHAQSKLIHTDRTGADISHLIVRDALEWNADMIVMGTHGRRGVTGWLVGSVAGRVARITKTPVLLVHASRA